jgi:hypothetical protein
LRIKLNPSRKPINNYNKKGKSMKKGLPSGIISGKEGPSSSTSTWLPKENKSL